MSSQLTTTAHWPTNYYWPQQAPAPPAPLFSHRSVRRPPLRTRAGMPICGCRVPIRATPASGTEKRCGSTGVRWAHGAGGTAAGERAAAAATIKGLAPLPHGRCDRSLASLLSTDSQPGRPLAPVVTPAVAPAPSILSCGAARARAVCCVPPGERGGARLLPQRLGILGLADLGLQAQLPRLEARRAIVVRALEVVLVELVAWR